MLFVLAFLIYFVYLLVPELQGHTLQLEPAVLAYFSFHYAKEGHTLHEVPVYCNTL